MGSELIPRQPELVSAGEALSSASPHLHTRSARAPRTTFAKTLCAVCLLVAAGCTTSIRTGPSLTEATQPALPNTTTTADAPKQASPTPLIDEFTSLAGGYTPYEIWAAVETERHAFIRGCMNAEGWTVDESILPPLPAEENEPRYFGGVVSEFMESLDQVDPPSQEPDPTESLPKEFFTQFNECTNAAVAAVADPRDSLFHWLEQHQDDMAAEFIAAPERADAEAAFRRCVQATGYDVTEPVEASNQIVDRGSQIVAGYERGEFTEDRAREALASLALEEQAMTDAFTPCYKTKIAAEQLIWAVIERNFLDEHGDSLALALSEESATIEGLLETLRSRERHG